MLKNHQILGRNGSYEILELLDRPFDTAQEDIVREFKDTISGEDIRNRISELTKIAFIRRRPKTPFLRITELGREALLLARVINGARLDSVLDQLSRFRFTRFSLITRDMSGCFLDILKSRSHFEEICICSPWIRLHRQSLRDLAQVFSKRVGRIFVRIVTRPPAELTNAPSEWRQQILETLTWFKRNGAELVKVKKVHTKLYCAVGRDWQIALFGSENLTEAENIELGIRIDDEIIAKRLLRYFERIYSSGEIIPEDELYV